MRPDVMRSYTPLTLRDPIWIGENQMKAMFHNAAFLATGVPIFDIRRSFGMTDMLVCDCAKGLALAETLEDKHVALMQATALVATGDSLQTAVFRAVYTEVNARIQLSAISIAEDGGIEALEPEEGILADEINKTAGMRAWNLWRMEIDHKTTGKHYGIFEARSCRLYPDARVVRYHRLQRSRKHQAQRQHAAD